MAAVTRMTGMSGVDTLRALEQLTGRSCSGQFHVGQQHAAEAGRQVRASQLCRAEGS